MFRVLITVALIQHNLGKPLEDGLLIPHDDVEMIPVEEHGHHIITTSSLERISIEENEISLKNDYEGEIDDDNNIPKPDGAKDTAPCSAEVEDTDESANCKDQSTESDLKQEIMERLKTSGHENVESNEGYERNKNVETTKETDGDLESYESQETNESVETTEGKVTDDDLETNEGQETKESIETTKGKETDDGVKSNEGKESNEIVETNEVVLLNQTLRMNSSAIVDGKLTIVLNFEVLDDNTVEVVSSEIVDPADFSKDVKKSDDDDDIVHFSGPVHARGKVCVAAHYGCGDDNAVEPDSSDIIHSADVSRNNNETVHNDDDTVHFSGPVHAHGKVCVAAHYGCGEGHTVEMDTSEKVHLGDNSKDSNETVDDEDGEDKDDGDEDDADEEDDDEDDENVHFCGSVHAQGNVCIGAHYGCGGPPISMCFSRPCGHGQQFSHTTSENDHDFQEEEDLFAHCQFYCPNIACQYYPSPCGQRRIPANHFDHHQNHIDHHHDHHFDHGQDHQIDRHHDHYDRHRNHHFDHSQNHLFNHHQDHDFDHYQDKFNHSHEYEDFEKYFSRVLGYSDYDSGEEDGFPRWFPVSGYVPASGSVQIAARY